MIHFSIFCLLATTVKTRNILKKHLQEKTARLVDEDASSGSRFQIRTDDEADLLELQHELNEQKLRNKKMEDQMLQMQKMMDVIILREQTTLNSTMNSSPIPSTIPIPDPSFMHGAAQVIQDSTQVEKTSPFLTSVSTEAWNVFDLTFQIYRDRTGKKFLRDCIKQEVLTYYQAQIQDNCRTMLCTDLRFALQQINKPFLDPMAILRTSLSMEST